MIVFRPVREWMARAQKMDNMDIFATLFHAMLLPTVTRGRVSHFSDNFGRSRGGACVNVISK